jgi:hypothetical protein
MQTSIAQVCDEQCWFAAQSVSALQSTHTPSVVSQSLPAAVQALSLMHAVRHWFTKQAWLEVQSAFVAQSTHTPPWQMLDAEQSWEFTHDLYVVQTPSWQCCPAPQLVSVAHWAHTWSVGSQRSFLSQSVFDAHIAPGVVDIPLDELLDACVVDVLELAVWPPIPEAVPLALVVLPPCPTAPVPVAPVAA